MASFIIISDTIEENGSHKKISKEIESFLNEFNLSNILFTYQEDGFVLKITIHLKEDEISQEVFGKMLPFVRNGERSFYFSFRFVSAEQAKEIDAENHVFISLDFSGWRNHLRNSFRHEFKTLIRGYTSEAFILASIIEAKKDQSISLSFYDGETTRTFSIKDILYSSDKEDREQGFDLQCVYIGTERSVFRFGVKSSEDGIRLRTAFKNIPQIVAYNEAKPFYIYRAICKMISYYEAGKIVSMVVSGSSTKEIFEN